MRAERAPPPHTVVRARGPRQTTRRVLYRFACDPVGQGRRRLRRGCGSGCPVGGRGHAQVQLHLGGRQLACPGRRGVCPCISHGVAKLSRSWGPPGARPCRVSPSNAAGRLQHLHWLPGRECRLDARRSHAGRRYSDRGSPPMPGRPVAIPPGLALRRREARWARLHRHCCRGPRRPCPRRRGDTRSHHARGAGVGGRGQMQRMRRSGRLGSGLGGRAEQGTTHWEAAPLRHRLSAGVRAGAPPQLGSQWPLPLRP
mmetsp:Transcript_59017/g.157814  ORF Transcript_59017/g.157814 Transcript_59017/m.157814 type:complete len:256 (+) Transcript_59017:289-1056(+)